MAAPEMRHGKRRRFRLQFSLRTMFLLFTLFALVCAWIGAGLAEARKQRIAVEALARRGGDVAYEEESDKTTPWWNSRRWLQLIDSESELFRTVERVSFSGDISDSEWEYYCGSFASARKVYIEGMRVSGEQLRCLSLMRNIRDLSFEYGEVSDEGLRHLANLRRLEYLTFVGTRLSGEGLKYLAELPCLFDLDLYAVNLSDAGQRSLGQLVQLQGLNLEEEDGHCNVAYITGLTNLRWLALKGEKFTDADVAHLVKMPWLESLSLDDAAVSNEGLKYIARIECLEGLSLSRTPVTDDGIAHLASLRNLACLNVSGTQLTDQGVAHLARLTNLGDLWLDHTPVTDQAVPHIQKLKRLYRLSLSGTRITRGGLKKLLEALPDLHGLYTPDGRWVDRIQFPQEIQNSGQPLSGSCEQGPAVIGD